MPGMSCLLLLSVLALQGDQPLSKADLPTVTLKHLGTISLQWQAPPPPPIRNVSDFDIDDRGRIGLIRHDGGAGLSFLLVTQQGELLNELAFDMETAKRIALAQLRWVGHERWVVASESHSGSAWWVDVKQGGIWPVQSLEAPSIDSIAADQRGGFVFYTRVLEKTHGTTYMFKGGRVFGVDSSGEQHLVATNEPSADRHMPFSASIAVTSDARIILLDQNTQDLIVFERDGRFLRTLKSGELRYCVPGSQEICKDAKGGVVWNDPYGSPTIRRIQVDVSRPTEPGKPYQRVEFQPRHPDGKIFAPLGGVRVDPHGKIWASDGQSVFRLNADGVVDLTLGQRDDPSILRDVSATFVDQKGRIYLLSRRTAAVHVFDEQGRLLHICKPDPTDFQGNLFHSMAVKGDGTVYTWDYGARYLEFSPSGKRIGFDTLGLHWVNGFLQFQPNGPDFWITHDREFHLATASGERLLTIWKRPDGKSLHWLEGETVAPNGALALIDDCQIGRDNMDENASDRYVLCLYRNDGKADGIFPIPAGLHPSATAFNGEYFVFWVTERLCGPPLKWSLLVCGVSSGAIRQVVTDAEHQDRLSGRPFFSNDGKELWLLQSKTKSVERFASP